MKTKILPNIFISVGVLFAFTRLLAGGMPQPTIITFDAPGAVDIVPNGINSAGAIVGYYPDANLVVHGFLRARDGTFTTFDAPGACTSQSCTNPFQGTLAWNINPAGAIAGYYNDASNVAHGYKRAPDGTITTFDAPGAGTGSFQGTYCYSINPAGAIEGYYVDASGVAHGYVRAPDGTITSFDAPGAGTGSGQGTYANVFNSLNPAGATAGGYAVGASFLTHGFVRAPDGTITTFDPPGTAEGPGQGSVALSINALGAIPGIYADANNVIHSFVRAPDGTFTTFDAPGAGAGPGQGTFAGDLNAAGAITGNYLDVSNGSHGFARAPDGTITSFDAPGAGTGPGQGTLPTEINQAGAITGVYFGSNGNHGFLRTP